MSHALLAPADAQQLVVVVHIPLVVEAVLLEGEIEGHPMTVPFGIDNHTIQIEENGPQSGHI